MAISHAILNSLYMFKFRHWTLFWQIWCQHSKERQEMCKYAINNWVDILYAALFLALPWPSYPVVNSWDLAESEAVTFILGLSSQLANVAHLEQKQKCHCAALLSPAYDWVITRPVPKLANSQNCFTLQPAGKSCLFWCLKFAHKLPSDTCLTLLWHCVFSDQWSSMEGE